MTFHSNPSWDPHQPRAKLTIFPIYAWGSKRALVAFSHEHGTHTHVCARVRATRYAHATLLQPATPPYRHQFIQQKAIRLAPMDAAYLSVSFRPTEGAWKRGQPLR